MPPLQRLRQSRPLLHCISNPVTLNDCANMALAAGASPIMAQDGCEVEEITAAADSLLLNLGVPSPGRLDSMLLAGKAASREGIPVTLDPVGCGASVFRGEAVRRLLEEVRIGIIRCNRSELLCLAGHSRAGGVDSRAGISLRETARIAGELAPRLGLVLAVTGKEDVVCDGARTAVLRNGHPMLGKITGAGCMCSVLVGCFCAVERDLFSAAAAGVSLMGVAGELAAQEAAGIGSFRAALLDAVGSMDEQNLERRVSIEFL